MGLLGSPFAPPVGPLVVLGGRWRGRGLGDFRFSNVDFRVGEMGSFCRNGGAEEEGAGGRAWGEAGVEGRMAKLDETVFT